MLEAMSLSHPVDKKQEAKWRRAVNKIEREHNVPLYGLGTPNAGNFWDAIKKAKKSGKIKGGGI